jgi:hypothetical protein
MELALHLKQLSILMIGPALAGRTILGKPIDM